jgi:DNA-damage-inducible protein D
VSDEAGQTSPFDAIKHEDVDGSPYWSARALAETLGYATNYRNFQPVIRKAEIACEASGYAVADHFAHVRTMVTIGSGASRRVEDVHLSRYACYLVVQNADPEKPIVALGQTYFAVQTRRQELSDEQLLDNMSEDQRRLFTRQQLVDRNRLLATTATTAGVITARDFAIFQDHGYMGLYNGERARDIAARKGLRPGAPILDHMGAEELAANLFRATQAEAKIRREGVVGKGAANATHHAVGREVRDTIARLGGTMPENLPTPAESIQQLERKERERLGQEAPRRRQPSLFGESAQGKLPEPDGVE